MLWTVCLNRDRFIDMLWNGMFFPDFKINLLRTENRITLIFVKMRYFPEICGCLPGDDMDGQVTCPNPPSRYCLQNQFEKSNWSVNLPVMAPFANRSCVNPQQVSRIYKNSVEDVQRDSTFWSWINARKAFWRTKKSNAFLHTKKSSVKIGGIKEFGKHPRIGLAPFWLSVLFGIKWRFSETCFEHRRT